MKKYLFMLCLASFVAGNANATPIAFSFSEDSTDFPWIGRDFTPGVVTGILYGLSDNGSGLLPTSIEFTSDVSSLGITNNVVSSFAISIGTGFEMSDGNVIGANLLLNFNDPTIGGMQIRFNYDNWNVLHWNGSNGPVLAMGNQNGFTGATYDTTSVPEPASIALLAIGLAGVGFSRKKKAI
jgi:hypothetical protein